MSRLSDYPVTRRWPPKHPDRLQLYSSPTPNGVKISIALEELGLPYEAHRLELSRNESRHSRSRWAGGRTAGALGVGRHPRLSR